MKLPKGVNGATSLPLTDVCDSARWTSIFRQPTFAIECGSLIETTDVSLIRLLG